jgi:hypothetical protein
LLLTRSDDFNAVAAAELRRELGHGHVFRVAPDPEEPDLLPPVEEAGILGAPDLTFAELSRRFADGARLVVRSSPRLPSDVGSASDVALFAIDASGRLQVAADGRPPELRSAEHVVVLERPAASGA